MDREHRFFLPFGFFHSVPRDAGMRQKPGFRVCIPNQSDSEASSPHLAIASLRISKCFAHPLYLSGSKLFWTSY